MIDLLAASYPDETVKTPRAGVLVPWQVDYAYSLESNRFFAENAAKLGEQTCDPVDLLTVDGAISSEEDQEAVLKAHSEFYSTVLGGFDQRVEGYETTLAATEQKTTPG